MELLQHDELDDYLGLPVEVELPDNIDPNDAADWLSDEYWILYHIIQFVG